MRLAVHGLFQAKWSAKIHEEWVENLLRNRPELSRERVERTREMMDQHAGDALVSGYEHLIPALILPDENDRHVLAAAAHSNADKIVTFNLGDFPSDYLALHNIVPQHPDSFIVELIRFDKEMVYRALRGQRAALQNPPMSIDDFLQTLERQGLPQTIAILKNDYSQL